MATELLYLKDFDVEQCDSTVQSVAPTDDGRVGITLDQTCFYPRGGGQDWDMGSIEAGEARFTVDEVRLDADGVVQHIGHFVLGTFETDAKVTCAVDSERRHVNTQLHSAGHLLDMAVEKLGWSWVPGRGAHYPHMSFVEYMLPAGAELNETMKTDLQAKINELRASTYAHKIAFVPVTDMVKYCRHIPPNIPTNKPSRIVLYADDFGIPCGGTHVRRASDIREIVVTKVKAKDGLVKVSYVVKGINA